MTSEGVVIRIFEFIVVTYHVPRLSTCLDRPRSSIDRPLPTDILDERLLTKGIIDRSLRGDSINNMRTDGSANPQSSWSTTTANRITPATSHLRRESRAWIHNNRH